MLLTFMPFVMAFSELRNNNHATNLCGPSVITGNYDNNGSEIYLVKLTNVATGQVYTIPHGTTGINVLWGIYDIEVYTDCQGLVKVESALGYSECQDAYSWSGDSKLYFFDNIDVRFCGALLLIIDEVEC